MNQDGWRQAYTCIRDFSRESDYQEGVDRQRSTRPFLKKGPMQYPCLCQRRVDVERRGTWDAE